MSKQTPTAVDVHEDPRVAIVVARVRHRYASTLEKFQKELLNI